MINIRKPEAELWESADLQRQSSKQTGSQYRMPALVLRYAYCPNNKMVKVNALITDILKAWEELI